MDIIEELESYVKTKQLEIEDNIREQHRIRNLIDDLESESDDLENKMCELTSRKSLIEDYLKRKESERQVKDV